nr:hypothetical protein P5630_01140 [Bacillus subtilis]
MIFNNWKYRDFKNDFVYLEDWMRLSIELANYVKKANQHIKLYISVPANLMFSYFFVLGAINYDFRNPSKETLLGKYLSLKKGQRILYKTGEDWIAHSVLEVSKVPNEETRAILVKDRSNCTTYIPEARWFDHVRIHKDEVTRVRNIRRVRNVENIVDNAKLRNLYSEYNLNLLMMQNIPKTYLCANQKEWKDSLSVIQFEIGEEHLQLDELLFDGTGGTFKNFSFIQQNHSSILPDDSMIIFAGSKRALRNMDQFKQQKCIFIIDQHEANEKVEELQLKIEREFLIDRCQSFNEDILKYIDNNQIEIPKGVEIFAWSQKS